MSLADNTQGPDDPSLTEAFRSLAKYLSSIDKPHGRQPDFRQRTQAGKTYPAAAQVAQLESISEDESPLHPGLAGVFILIDVPGNEQAES